ncbi:hypothetical protein CDD83_7637 [Cordyceps sp. RAO-2017]|nr:hypothetical protein CDD83_7637 [Cordyceps sp. RAO-2017]
MKRTGRQSSAPGYACSIRAAYSTRFSRHRLCTRQRPQPRQRRYPSVPMVRCSARVLHSISTPAALASPAQLRLTSTYCSSHSTSSIRCWSASRTLLGRPRVSSHSGSLRFDGGRFSAAYPCDRVSSKCRKMAALLTGRPCDSRYEMVPRTMAFLGVSPCL